MSLKSSLILIVVHAVAALFAMALSVQSTTVAGIPAAYGLIGAVFVIQWIAFIPAYHWQTERFFDLTGSLTYVFVSLAALVIAPVVTATKLVVAFCIVIWALRLGLFLVLRIRKDGKDGRFDDIKPNAGRFLTVWCIQALWITVTSSAAVVVLTSEEEVVNSPLLWLGLVVWTFGFLLEVIADEQKRRFRAAQTYKDRFIQYGLWRVSRHPNYLGEILLWCGIAVMAVPSMEGWRWLGMVSPLFVFLLLRYVSGVPLLEQRSDDRWEHLPEYQAYKQNTPMLIPSFRAIQKK
ncbi:DUF1295 domain-containing protein [Reinekea sp. G2M2-21]|uniref:DUF1295 domain-containing protein n=1 Tax=Reinekea sp. G2M2-21 TaxID=2788942 RepID=UPI0018A99A24|nr:DUF1295 domain-containing protein [Reinekea sp. G2M2-21]